ncbi:MAG: chorismate synthase [Spirochaetaceae bacterium 4572_59]|nr:MAG: chorismate synthase [Spirochaetaceae bacterium 4572_59]
MAGNSFGTAFRITTFGESHGISVGVIVDGVPPGISLSETDIQPDMDRRKPGQSDMTSPRKESDTVTITSGVFEGRTTGTPLMIMLQNTNTISSDYNDVMDKYRPGHADYTYQKKYGIRDWRGSGRASGRETAARVAAGAVAKKILAAQGISLQAYTLAAAGIVCEKYIPEQIESNSMRACDPDAALKMKAIVEQLIKEGNSAGGIVECRIKGVSPGLGEPVFDKLEADLAKGIMSIGAVKGFEIGEGFACAHMKGSQHNDAMNAKGFLTNHAGGISGGISTGQEIIFRAAVKPTASISSLQHSIDLNGNETEIRTKGRHDPIICPRIIPVMEAMAAIVLCDHLLRLNAQRSLQQS